MCSSRTGLRSSRRSEWSTWLPSCSRCVLWDILFRGNLWDMFVAIFAGVLGYTLSKAGFSVVTLVIGFLLGEVAERTFFQSMAISNNDFLSFFRRPAGADPDLCVLAGGRPRSVLANTAAQTWSTSSGGGRMTRPFKRFRST